MLKHTTLDNLQMSSSPCNILRFVLLATRGRWWLCMFRSTNSRRNRRTKGDNFCFFETVPQLTCRTSAHGASGWEAGEEGREREAAGTERGQWDFSLVFCDTCSVKLARMELTTVCLTLSSIYCSLSGFNTCKRIEGVCRRGSGG